MREIGCCAGTRIHAEAEFGLTETLEVIPRQWKVIQTVREKFSCRECEKITQPPAPFHVTPRGFAGPNLLAMILFEKFGQHQPLNRQSERYRREGIDLSVSTLAGQVGACTTALRPLHALIERHVLAAERLHGDDTTVPILAKGKTVTGRIWTYVRDDRPFGGHAPPAALYYASRDRKHEHPMQHLQAFTGILQADAYSGYNELYDPSRSQGAITAALCWAHARRQFFELADIAANARRGKNAAAISPVALAAVKRIDALFDIERDINGLSAEERLRVRQEQSAPFWLLWKRGCVRSTLACRVRPLSPSRSTTCSSVGTGLPASSKMAGSASRTMQPSVLFEDLRCLSHCASLLQVSVNIGIVLSSATRHGRPFRATAVLTDSDARSSARI